MHKLLSLQIEKSWGPVLGRFVLALCTSVSVAIEVRSQPEVATAAWWPGSVESALAQAETNRTELVRALQEVAPAQRAGLQFLLENMPRRDLRGLSAAFLLENVQLAYEALADAPWHAAIPPDLFLNDILPYANINEHREAWRKTLREKCAPLVKDCQTPGEAAHRLNSKLFGLVNVKYSTQRRKADQSPFESMETGLASCTGLSILLVDACRSVGVPARLAGIPNWVDKRGNHTWVEVWDQQWHFVGAAEPDPNGLDHGWFQHDASLAIKDSKEHAIYAVSFKRTDLPFPMVWARGVDYVSAQNVTDRYAAKPSTSQTNSTRLLIKVMDHPGGKRVAAQITVADPADAKVQFEGVSKDETADLNDIQSFLVPRNRSYVVKIASSGSSLRREYASGDREKDLLEVCLDDQDKSIQAASGLPAATCTAPSFSAPKADELKAALKDFFRASPEKQAGWTFAASLEQLLQQDEEATRRLAWESYCSSPVPETLESDYGSNCVQFEQYISPYTVRQVGQKPATGWPLFIAMHGGGNTPKRVNDSQWRVMQHYYRDQPSVPGYLYLALRAPNDTWNGFYDNYVYPLVGNLTRQFLIFGEVDPNKVFLMGYSHGGYGAFAIGPKMPDHFAAIHASAGAPTDGETSPKTLRHTVFSYMIGEKDLAYGRLQRCTNFDLAIQQLRGDRTNVYPVTMEFKPGYGHTGLPDRDKIKDMYPAVRNPVPRDLSWAMTDSVITNFFWLEAIHPAKGQEILATCEDNHLTVQAGKDTVLNVLLDRRLVDMQQPLRLTIDGSESVRALKPELLTLCQTLLARGDPDLAFSIRIPIRAQ